MEQLKFQEEVADSGGENPVMGGAEVLLWLDFQFSNKTLTTKKEPFFQRNKNFRPVQLVYAAVSSTIANLIA